MIGRILSFIRTLFLTPYFLIHTMVLAIVVWTVSFIDPGRSRRDWIMARAWAGFILWLAGVEVEFRGRENWPEGKGYLILFSHTSWMDILAMSNGLPKVPRFGAKIELFRLPFFGAAMRRCGMLPIERNQRAKVLQTYKEAESRARAGESFALAPEGTRQVGHELGRFKRGPFIFAVGAQIPLLPLVIAGAQEVMPKGSWGINSTRWRSKIIMYALAPIETAGFQESDIGMLQSKAYEAMAPVYSSLNRELGQTS